MEIFGFQPESKRHAKAEIRWTSPHSGAEIILAEDNETNQQVAYELLTRRIDRHTANNGMER